MKTPNSLTKSVACRKFLTGRQVHYQYMLWATGDQIGKGNCYKKRGTVDLKAEFELFKAICVWLTKRELAKRELTKWCHNLKWTSLMTFMACTFYNSPVNCTTVWWRSWSTRGGPRWTGKASRGYCWGSRRRPGTPRKTSSCTGPAREAGSSRADREQPAGPTNDTLTRYPSSWPVG